jgi:hypothetical protein
VTLCDAIEDQIYLQSYALRLISDVVAEVEHLPNQ